MIELADEAKNNDAGLHDPRALLQNPGIYDIKNTGKS